jgi:hypothetical protein
MVRTLGGFIEPVLAPNTSSTITVQLNGVAIASSGIASPGTPTLSSSSGGILAATTYYAQVAWVTNSGITLTGSEANSSVAASSLLIVKQPSSAPAGAIDWGIYVASTSSGGSGTETLQATVAIGTSSWTMPSSGLVTGSSLPGANTTGWIINGWGTSSTNGAGSLVFNGAVVSSVAISSTFSYYWPCRFVNDKQAFANRFWGVFDAKKISFISVKN